MSPDPSRLPGSGASSGPSRARVLAIGLDSADRRYLWRLVEAGQVPNIAALIARGRSGVVRSPPALGDDAVWASFAAASPPGHHGRFFWKRLVPGSYSPSGHSSDGAPRPFWSRLADRGHRVAVLDVPKSPLCEMPGGLQLSDWLVHGRDGPTRSHPPEVAGEVLARYGDDRIDRPGTDDFLCREHALDPALHQEFLSRLHSGLAAKRRATADFLSRGGWDLFLVVFKECHCVGHEFWDRVGEGEGASGADDSNPVLDVYRELDAAVGDLMGQVGDEAHVLLFSGLGMDANYTAEHLLDRALLRLEPGLVRYLEPVYHRLVAVEERVRRRLPGWRGSAVRGLRRAYQVEHNELSGAVRINVRGREPSGRVRRGADLEACYASLEAALGELVDPDTGEPVVDRVVRTDTLYPGEGRDALPDLFVVWRRDRVITGLASEAVGEIRSGDPGYRAGNHVADGFYVLAGPSIDRPGPGEPLDVTALGPAIEGLVSSSGARTPSPA